MQCCTVVQYYNTPKCSADMNDAGGMGLACFGAAGASKTTWGLLLFLPVLWVC